jgi:hypothetical protein
MHSGGIAVVPGLTWKQDTLACASCCLLRQPEPAHRDEHNRCEASQGSFFLATPTRVGFTAHSHMRCFNP